MRLSLLFILLLYTISFTFTPIGLIKRVNTKEKVVVLTFDDGPLPKVTDKILAILKENRVQATFFLIGTNVIKYPHLVERIYFENHDIANHTYHHSRLDTLPNSDFIDYEITETDSLLQSILGIKPRYFRPPGGRTNHLILDRAKANKLKSIGWSINTSDFLYNKHQKVSIKTLEKKKKRILKLLKRNLSPGAIILMHNGSVVSTYVLPDVIKTIQEEGYRIAKLSTLIP